MSSNVPAMLGRIASRSNAPTKVLGEGLLRGESQREARRHLAEILRHARLEKHFDGIRCACCRRRAVLGRAALHLAVLAIRRKFRDELATRCERRATVERRRLRHRRIELPHKPSLRICAGSFDLAGTGTQAESLSRNSALEGHGILPCTFSALRFAETIASFLNPP